MTTTPSAAPTCSRSTATCRDSSTAPILGHEFVGVVERSGRWSTTVRAGDRVVSTSTIRCGRCAPLPGRAAVPMPRAGAVRVLGRLPATRWRSGGAGPCALGRPLPRNAPDGVPDEAAVFVADMLPTGYSAVRRADLTHRRRRGRGRDAGRSARWPSCSRARLARKVIAVDGIPARRDAGRALRGASRSHRRRRAARHRRTPPTASARTASSRPPGAPGPWPRRSFARGRGTVSVVGAHFEPDFPLNNGLMFEKELTLRVTWGDAFTDRDGSSAMLAAGEIDPTPAITHCSGSRRPRRPTRVRGPRSGQGAPHAVAPKGGCGRRISDRPARRRPRDRLVRASDRPCRAAAGRDAARCGGRSRRTRSGRARGRGRGSSPRAGPGLHGARGRWAARRMRSSETAGDPCGSRRPLRSTMRKKPISRPPAAKIDGTRPSSASRRAEHSHPPRRTTRPGSTMRGSPMHRRPSSAAAFVN